jgi:hypothetical protein
MEKKHKNKNANNWQNIKKKKKKKKNVEQWPITFIKQNQILDLSTIKTLIKSIKWL